MDNPLVIGGLVVGAAVVLYLAFGRKKKRSPPIDAKEWRKFTLIEKEDLTSGVACPVTRFRFALDHPEDVLNLPPGNHMSLRTYNPETGDEHLRSYTPTTLDEKGYFDLVVKIYPKGVMGRFLQDRLPIGGQIEVRGPKGRFTYEAGKYDHIGMLAGGSGITPMYQIMRAIKQNSSDKCKCSLLNGNITVDDIILRKELDTMSSDQFDIFNVLNNPPEGWEQGSGFISQDHMKPRFPPPGPRMKILVCGPPPMIKAMEPHLKAMGYTKEHYFLF
eukprot:TRINITY_DN29478_c0_g1_i1.p1 TRINITY_DN29478_c0_g1~~TRINITY_DN29478_c0_g1_i1.p1  ORF type:complete len:274 (+),score=28.48 TRINITY_DN29478_c0_g1_i1:30-851(+)